MKFRLEGKVAIVTGAARGIGKEIATALAKEGANLALCDLDIERLEKHSIKLEEEYGLKALPFKVDVSKSDQILAMVEEVVKRFGKIDILVNNAGIAIKKRFLDISEKEWNEVIDVNLKGVFLFSQAVAKRMIEGKIRGSIVNISSIAGIIAYGPAGAPYSASKAGVNILTKHMAYELAPFGIRVNAIAPGIVETELSKSGLKNEVSRASRLKRIPLGRIGKPEDVARAVVFLASDESSYITGEVLVVDGGMISAVYFE